MLKEVAMDAAAAQAFDLAGLNRAFLDDPYPTYRGFNRPGGNITGISFLINALVSKRLELLRELVPTVTMIAFLVRPSKPAA